VLGVADPLADAKALGAEFEARAVPLIMTAIPALPNELARLMAQYAHVISRGSRIIAGVSGSAGHADGPALFGALLRGPTAIAIDDTDPVAGPQLIIGDNSAVRSLNLRTEMVTTIAGSDLDGPASRARFDSVYGIAVAPNGVLFVVDRQNVCVRRISPVRSATAVVAPAKAPAERMVTTLIGASGPNVQFARSASKLFRRSIPDLWGLWGWAFHAPPLPAHPAAADGDDEVDVGHLYVGTVEGVHVFDLAEGSRRCLRIPTCAPLWH
jgi:hypothetical protein